MRKAQMVLKEFILLVMVAIVFFVLFSFIARLGASVFDVRSATEKSFDVFTSEVQRLVDMDDEFVQNEHFLLTLDDEYALVGFDKSYDPLLFIAFNHQNERLLAKDFYLALYPGLDRITTGRDFKRIEKPDSCGMHACICLLKGDEIEVCKPIADTREVVIASYPFQRFDGASFDIFDLKQGRDWSLPVQNLGIKRDNLNDGFKDTLKSKGFSDDWIEPYAYLALAGEIRNPRLKENIHFDTTQLYIEKLSVKGHEIIFIVPDVGLYSSITPDIAEKRRGQYEEYTQVYERTEEIRKLAERLDKEKQGMTPELKKEEVEKMYDPDSFDEDLERDLYSIFWEENWEDFVGDLGLDPGSLAGSKQEAIEDAAPGSIDTFMIESEFGKSYSYVELEDKKEEFYDRNYPSFVVSIADSSDPQTLDSFTDEGIDIIYSFYFSEDFDFVEANYKRIYRECETMRNDFPELELPDICSEIPVCEVNGSCHIDETDCICRTYFGTDFCTGDFCYYNGCTDEKPPYPTCRDIRVCETDDSCMIEDKPTGDSPCKCLTDEHATLCDSGDYCYRSIGCTGTPKFDEYGEPLRCGIQK